MKIAFLLVTVFASCNGQMRPTCEDEFHARQQSCADENLKCLNGLDDEFIRNFASGLYIASLTREVITVLCANKETAETILRCTLRETKGCEGQLPLPSADGVVEAISYLCQNAGDVNLTCAEAAMKSLKVNQCIGSNASKIPPGDATDVDSAMQYYCREEVKLMSCRKQAMSNCPGNTAEIVYQVSNYQKPAACTSDASMVKITWGLLVISLCYI